MIWELFLGSNSLRRKFLGAARRVESPGKATLDGVFGAIQKLSWTVSLETDVKRVII